MDPHDDLRELTRRVRERLAFYDRGGVDALPRPVRVPRRRPPVETALRDGNVPAYDRPGPGHEGPRIDPASIPISPPLTAMPSKPRPGSAPILPPPVPSQWNDPRGAAGLRVIRDDLGDCQRCGLARTRTNIVFGVGNPEAPLVFVGEGPGENEDLRGEPFVGKAGELLTKMIAAMGFSRDDVYICNVVKCRPPGNRNPLPDEITACEPFLIRQLGAIAPRVIVALGKFAAQTLLRNDAPISALRGNWHRYSGIALMPTFHPAYVLRNPASKTEVWNDLKLVIAELDRLGVPHGVVGQKQQ